jgi:hypothetical protein
MRPSFENKVKLVVSDFECSPDVISETLGMEASQTWLKGDSVIPQAKTCITKMDGWHGRQQIQRPRPSKEPSKHCLTYFRTHRFFIACQRSRRADYLHL